MSPNILTVVGARPQFVKAAALSRAIGRTDATETMLHTGQHFDRTMSDIFFEELAIPPPTINLGVHGGNHGEMTGKMLAALETVMLERRPDIVVVFGDTNSTLAAGLAAVKLHIPVAHVEAGLRSFNRAMPEEINRVVVDHISDLLLCPTAGSVRLLASEGITDGVHHVGDVMYDATLHALERARLTSTIMEQIGIDDRPFVLATLHRAETTDDPARLRSALDFLRSHRNSGQVVLPIHPRTAKAVARADLSLEGLNVIDPVGYLDMTALLDAAALVLTDSGGVQKEAYFHRTPCITLRSETEWTETVEAGWNRLWTDPEVPRERREIPDYGTGFASEEITKLILGHLEGRPPGPR